MSKPQKLPSGSWRIQWLDADGKRQSATYSTHDLARSELRRLEVETEDIAARRRRDPALASTVAEAYARYKATDKPINTTERRHTRKWTRIDQHYRDHIGPDLGGVLLADLTPSRLKAWIASLAAKKTARPGERNAGGRTLSAASVRAIVVTLRQIAKASDVPLVYWFGVNVTARVEGYRT